MAEMIENAEIVERRKITDSLYILRVKFLKEQEFPFKPGQYAELALPEVLHPTRGKVIRRQYSISSIETDNRGIELFISTVSDGLFTPYLAKKRVGDLVWLGDKAKGKFVLDGLKSKRLILISTGTGIAPFISMLRNFSENSDYPWKNITLLQGARRDEDLAYHEECKAFTHSLPFHYLPCLSRLSPEEQNTWPGLAGRVTEILGSAVFAQRSGASLSKEDDTVLLCGNPQMITDACTILEQREFSVYKKKTGGNIHFERYW